MGCQVSEHGSMLLELYDAYRTIFIVSYGKRCLLLSHLYVFPSLGEGEDMLKWMRSKSGIFKVKSFYEAFLGNWSWVFPWRGVWVGPSLLQRLIFLAWMIKHEKILTIDNLRRRHSCELLLYVQGWWGISFSFSHSLCGGKRYVVWFWTMTINYITCILGSSHIQTSPRECCLQIRNWISLLAS